MNFSKRIKELEKKGIISRKPNPIVPFILCFISFALGILVSYIDVDEIYSNLFFFLAVFSFVFAVLHLIAVRILRN